MVKKPIRAIYSNGVFTPLGPVEMEEGETVLISVEAQKQDILALATQVYDGLSEKEVQEIEEIALDRKNFFGERS